MFSPSGSSCKIVTDSPVPVSVENSVQFTNSSLTINVPATDVSTLTHSATWPRPLHEGVASDVSSTPHQPGRPTASGVPPSTSDVYHKNMGEHNREEYLAKHEARIKTFWPEPTTTARKKFPLFFDIYAKIKATARPNCFAAKIPLDSGLVIPAWRQELSDYHDKDFCDYLEFGWPLGYHSNVSPETTTSNHPSGKAHLDHVKGFISKELDHKAVLGPFQRDPFQPWVRYSPIMTRPKRDSDQRRVILDLSFPKSRAVNDGIAIENHFGLNISYTLPTIQDFASRLIEQGDNAYMWKVDLRRAYQQLRADPLDAPLLGMKVGSDIYIDLCPPFGCRSSAAICQKMANALVYIMNKKGFFLLAYLDDFGASYASKKQAEDSFQTFVNLAARLGLSLAQEKSVPPTHVMEWLGYTVDSRNMSIKIPHQKLQAILQDCKAWLNKTRANKKTIQEIVGRLLYISNCVLPGRKFTSRILGTLRAMEDKQWTTLTPEFKADLRWFAAYAEASNGLYLISPSRPQFNIECDASLLGAGGNSATQCYQWTFTPQHIKAYSIIHHLEAINVLVAIRTLVPKDLSPHEIVVWTDNLASAWALHTGRTKDTILAACAREIWLMASVDNHTISIKHKPGSDIPLADALSRAAHNIDKARTAATLVKDRSLTYVNPVLNGYVFFSSFL